MDHRTAPPLQRTQERRQPLLDAPRRRDFFLELLEQTRQRYDFVVVGYVVMPEHFHVLISEPERGTPSTVMQVVKQRFAKHVLGGLGEEQLASCKDKCGDLHVWMERFYDFNVWTAWEQGKLARRSVKVIGHN